MQSKNYSIKEWAEDDRPREKLLSKRPTALSDSELLAILINNGNKKQSAVELGRDIMKLAKNNLNDLFKLTVKELITLPGIGPAKAITIVAALELGRRRYAKEGLGKSIVTSSHDVANHLRALLRDRTSEAFGVLYLNQSNRINHFGIVSEGGITSTVADPRLIIKKALEEEAVNLILCHNHPSGNLKPSAADQLLTHKIKEAATLFDIRVLDHIIVSEEGYYSFADEGIL
jgi:DNA repair protein RadC